MKMLIIALTLTAGFSAVGQTNNPPVLPPGDLVGSATQIWTTIIVPLLALMATIGRTFYGIKNGRGFKGTFGGLFFGNNTPSPEPPTTIKP